ncbi:MAG TPA: hypothetical protein VD884_17455 [Ohtaekwangia sp.]|nr:hypothetical protein [Ohtaekwangia sp.]
MTNFDSILKAITRSKKGEGYRCVVLGEVQNISKITIFYPESYDDDFEALKCHIGTKLTNSKHRSSEQIILAVLNLVLDLCENSPSPVRRMEEFLESFCKAKVKMIYSSRGKGQIKDILFGKFRMGVLDWEQISRLISTQTQSDYHSRYSHLLIGAIVVEQSPMDIIVLNTTQYSAKVNHKNNCNLDYYFESLRLVLFKDFLQELEQQSKLLTGLMGVFFDPDILFNFLGGESIAIFYRIDEEKGLGWVNAGAYRLQGINLQSFREIEDGQALLARVEKALGINSGFSSILKLFTQFMADAEMLAYKKRRSEAFMNFMVGLDAIFNFDTDQASSFNLKKRVSVITSLKNGKSYQDEFAALTVLYVNRSEFVHAGKTIDEDLLKQIRQICRTVVSVLINVSLKESMGVEEWLQNLDIAGDQLHRRLAVNAMLKEKCGIE